MPTLRIVFSRLPPAPGTTVLAALGIGVATGFSIPEFILAYLPYLSFIVAGVDLVWSHHRHAAQQPALRQPGANLMALVLEGAVCKDGILPQAGQSHPSTTPAA